MIDLEWKWVSEDSILVTVPGGLEEAARLSVAIAGHLLAQCPAGMREVVPGAGNVLIRLRPGIKAPERVASAVIRIAREGRTDGLVSMANAEHRFPVEYGGEAGPDLGDVARIAGLDERGVVAVHSSAVYTVAFVGFSPGFPYLVGLPAALHAARLPSPRTRVPKGSVAIAGPFAGIYPRESPGGWRLLGQTDIDLFDCQCSRPALLAPGDTVRFIPG